jgi:hypothetical protein
MAKRGRPKNPEISVWDKKYYQLSPERDNVAINKMKEERLIKAYNYVHLMAFGEELSVSQIKHIRSLLYLE